MMVAIPHFIYSEDDIRLSFANFRYFVEFRERLRPIGLLPAFVRTEFSAAQSGLVASDAFSPVYVPVQPHVMLDGLVMANMPNPYNPCFFLDRELAEEYVRTPSFDRVASAGVNRWDVRERAAMGLCLENVPKSFHMSYQSQRRTTRYRRLRASPIFLIIMPTIRTCRLVRFGSTHCSGALAPLAGVTGGHRRTSAHRCAGTVLPRHPPRHDRLL